MTKTINYSGAKNFNLNKEAQGEFKSEQKNIPKLFFRSGSCIQHTGIERLFQLTFQSLPEFVAALVDTGVQPQNLLNSLYLSPFTL